jgi:hypothetical protein
VINEWGQESGLIPAFLSTGKLGNLAVCSNIELSNDAAYPLQKLKQDHRRHRTTGIPNYLEEVLPISMIQHDVTKIKIAEQLTKLKTMVKKPDGRGVYIPCLMEQLQGKPVEVPI